MSSYKLVKHEPCWDQTTRTGYFRPINLLSYTQRVGKYRGKWVTKDYYIKPKRGSGLFACENCGQIRVLRLPL